MIKLFSRNLVIINADALVSLAIYFLWIAAVFDPIGKVFGARYFALGSIYFLLLIMCIMRPDSFVANRFYWIIFSFFCLIIPGYGLIVGFFRGGLVSEFRDTSYIAAGVLFGCSIVYLKNDFLKIGVAALIASLRLLSLVIIYTLIIYLCDFSTDYIYFFVENEAAFLGSREYGGIIFYYFYFIASPMLIFLVVYESWRFLDKPSLYGFLLLYLAVVALFLSGTRVNMLLAIFTIPLVFLWKRFSTFTLFLLPLILLFIVLLFKIFPVDFIGAMFSSDEYSNKTKINLLNGYASIFANPLNLIFGQGFNAHVWSFEFSKMVGDASKVELTYIEMFRVFGVLIGTLFLIMLYIIIRGLGRVSYSYQWLAPAFFLYLLMSTLNPYIFSTNGMLPIGLLAVVLGKHILYSRVGKPTLHCAGNLHVNQKFYGF